MAWSYIKTKLSWVINDGHTTRFWQDQWVDGIINQKDYVLAFVLLSSTHWFSSWGFYLIMELSLLNPLMSSFPTICYNY